MSDLSERIEAVRRDPASPDAAAALRERARELGDLAAYARAFADRGRALVGLGRAEEGIESLLEAAHVFEEETEDLDAAASAYRQILELRPDDRRALFSLGLVLHDLARWEDLVALYRRRLERAIDSGEETTLHLYIAEILSERLDRHEDAFREIATASRLAPENLRIVGRLEQLGERIGRIGEVAVTIGDLILHQEDPRVRAALSLRLAQLHMGPLEDEKRALACLRAALVDDGGDPQILTELEDVFRERARFDGLARVLEETIGDRRIGPHRARLGRELARVYEHELGDPSRALAALSRAAVQSPDDRELLDEVMRLGLLSSDFVTVAETYEQVSELTENPLLTTYARLKLGHIYGHVLGDRARAIRAYRAILAGDPSHQEAGRRLARLDPDLAADARLALASPAGEGADDADDDVLEMVSSVVLLEEDPVQAEAGFAIQASPALLTSCESRAASGARAEQEMAAGDAADHPAGADHDHPFEVPAEARPDRESDPAPEAIAEIRDLVEPDAAPDPAESRSPQDLLDDSLRDLEQIDAPAARVVLRMQIARLAEERLGSTDFALDMLAKAAEEASEPLSIYVEIERLLGRQGDDEGLLHVLSRKAAVLEAPRARADTHVAIAELRAGRFGDLEGASEALRDALASDPEHEDAWRRLAAIEERREDFLAAMEALGRLAPLVDPKERAEVHVAIARILEGRFGDRAAAEEAYRAAHACDADNLEANLALLTVAEEAGDFVVAAALAARALEADPDDLETEARLGESLLSLHEHARAYPHVLHAARNMADPDRAGALSLAAAQTAERLERPDEAEELYERALAFLPTDAEALSRLGALLSERGPRVAPQDDWQRVNDLGALLILHHEQDLAPAERSSIYIRMARAKHALGEGEAAARLARKARDLDAERLEPLELLALLLEEPGAEAYRLELGDVRGAAGALEATARRLEGRPSADMLVRAAKIAAGPLADRALAKQLLGDALGVVPTHAEALEHVAVMHEFDGDIAKLAEALERAALAFLDDPTSARDAPGGDRERSARDLLDRAIRLYRDRLNAPERALLLSKKLLVLAPDRMRHREEYARLLDALASARDDAVTVREAIGAWAHVVERYPGYTHGLRRLSELRSRAGDVELARLTAEILSVLGEDVAIELGAPRAVQAAVPGPLEVPLDPGERSTLGSLLEEIGVELGRATEDALPEPRVRKRDVVGAAGMGIQLHRSLVHGAKLLGLPVPEVARYDDAPLAAWPVLLGDRPALLVSVTQAERCSEEALRFIVTRALSLMRPRAFPLATVPLPALREALVGFSRLSDPASHYVDPKRARRRAKSLERLVPENGRARLAHLAAAWLEDPERTTLGDERRAVMRSADRAGLVACGSLLTALEALANAPDGPLDQLRRVPLLRFAATRQFAEIVRRMS